MQTKTLAELKAENAAAEENADLEGTPEEVAEIESGEVVEESAESEEGEGTKKTPEPESWMLTGEDEESEEAEKKFTNSDVWAAKKKLRAKLESKHNSEVDELRAEIERLKTQTVPQGKELERPKRSDFDDAEDPEEAYIEAVTDWKINKSQAERIAKTKQTDLQAKQLERKAQITEYVDQHYERAVQLAETAGIAPEVYQGADLMVRREVENLFPNQGDAITDGLIASVGEGSEKIFYSLGVNATKRAQFASLLKQDPTGIQAAIYLGSLKTELSAPTKRKSNAPAPAPNLNGDKGVNNGGDFHKQYKKAKSANDMNAAINSKLAAKRAGVNVKDW